MRIAESGTGGDRQIKIDKQALAAGRRRLSAIKDVIDWAASETLAAGDLASAA